MEIVAVNDSEILRSITTLGAVFVGFILGQISEWIKSTKKSKKQKNSVRKLIELEIKNNIKHVENFWKWIIESDNEWKSEDGSFRYVKLADKATLTPFPPLTTAAWGANLNEVTKAYTEHELEAIWDFQRKLEHVRSLYNFFCESQNNRKEYRINSYASRHNPAIGSLIGSINFSESVYESAKEFKILVEKIIEFKPAAAGK